MYCLTALLNITGDFVVKWATGSNSVEPFDLQLALHYVPSDVIDQKDDVVVVVWLRVFCQLGHSRYKMVSQQGYYYSPLIINCHTQIGPGVCMVR